MDHTFTINFNPPYLATNSTDPVVAFESPTGYRIVVTPNDGVYAFTFETKHLGAMGNVLATDDTREQSCNVFA
jgi:hypothetical protein